MNLLTFGLYKEGSDKYVEKENMVLVNSWPYGWENTSAQARWQNSA